MKTETKVLGGILILTLVLLIGGVFFLSSTQTPKPVDSTPVVQIDYSKGQKIGSDSAKVKLVEFSDFECPACLAAEPAVKKIRSEYPPEKFQFIYRYFPLTQHPHSRQASYLGAAAAEQGKFWEMHDKLFDTQSQWSPQKDATPFLLDLAKQLGLDENKVQQEISNDTFKPIIDADIAEGERVGVNATPTFFLNGHKLILENFSNLETAVADEVKKLN